MNTIKKMDLMQEIFLKNTAEKIKVFYNKYEFMFLGNLSEILREVKEDLNTEIYKKDIRELNKRLVLNLNSEQINFLYNQLK